LNAFAQLALKAGMRTIGVFSFSLENIIPVGIRVILNPFIISGLGCYVVSVIIWLMVLSRVEVSYAYPMLSIGYIVTAFCGYIFFGENMNSLRWLGVIAIFVGVFLITMTG
jgi:drug/metabolite transporter (DMT)-like permease